MFNHPRLNGHFHERNLTKLVIHYAYKNSSFSSFSSAFDKWEGGGVMLTSQSKYNMGGVDSKHDTRKLR